MSIIEFPFTLVALFHRSKIAQYFYWKKKSIRECANLQQRLLSNEPFNCDWYYAKIDSFKMDYNWFLCSFILFILIHLISTQNGKWSSFYFINLTNVDQKFQVEKPLFLVQKAAKNFNILYQS